MRAYFFPTLTWHQLSRIKSSDIFSGALAPGVGFKPLRAVSCQEMEWLHCNYRDSREGDYHSKPTDEILARLDQNFQMASKASSWRTKHCF
jgi:hypothetical protein